MRKNPSPGALILAAVFASSLTSPQALRGAVVIGHSFRFETVSPPASAQPPESPMSLTATDGTGLALTKLAANAVVEGPLAFTELKLAFTNTQDRVIEGHFRITLPPGAAVSRFAMKLDERWQEGEVVERQKARAAYEDFLHRRQDPALLEQAAANEFSARVFPIPAKGVKELIISYSQELPRSGAPYALALRGLPEVGEVEIDVQAGSSPIGRLRQRRWVPSADFTAQVPESSRVYGLRHGNLALVRVSPLTVPEPDEMTSLLILMDVSASRALGLEEQLRLLDRLSRGLAAGAGPETPFAVATFDQDAQALYEGTAGGFGAEGLRRLRRRGAMGASDLQAALRWAAERLKARPYKRVLLLTDGVATAGTQEAELLAAEVRKLKTAGVERLDAVALGGIRDEAALKRLVTAGLSRDGIVADGTLDAAAIAAKLTQATRSDLKVEVEGASWSWPRRLDGLQAGDEVMIYAELPKRKRLKLSIGGRPASLPASALVEAERPLVERAWAQAKIRSLLEKHGQADGEAAKAKVREELVALSTRHRVLCPYTALLVLETEQDYARYSIDRKALSDILTIKDGRAVLAPRGPDAVVLAPKPRVPDVMMPMLKRATAGAAAMPMAALDGGPALSPADEPVPEYDMEATPEPMPLSAPDTSDGGGGGSPGVMAQLRMEVAGSEARQTRELRARPPGPFSPPSPRPIPPPAGRPAPPPKGVAPYTGKFRTVMELIAEKKTDQAARLARAWLEESPGDVMALVALGESLEAAKDYRGAARAYGSLIDLFPSRADMRRFAGERLERLPEEGLDIALDAYRAAREQRPDHPASHRLYAFALLKKGLYQQAFEALAEGLARNYPEGRFKGVDRILREDLGLIAAAWIKAEPSRRAEILDRLKKAGGSEETEPSLRFVLNWETDANDVDFHIQDAKGGHAYFSSPTLPSGGELYADVTTGYGPECFTIRLPKDRRAYPYTLQAHYYSRGPMGYGMGKLQIIEHDGRGRLEFTERPFVVMADQAYVDLGKVAR